MKLNCTEFFLMNNPLRRSFQKHVEMSRMKRISSLSTGKELLEIGCGSGYGSKLIKGHFLPKKLYSIDLDKNMIDLAKKWQDEVISFKVMNATNLHFKEKKFDAIIDFGIIHHIPNWKDCIDELKRVLKPGGQLILEDLSIETFSTPFGKFLRRILKHPYESMYAEDEFIEYLKKQRFKILKYKRFKFPIRYFLLVAQK